MRKALEAIAGMRIDETTDYAQLAALCIAIARESLRNAEPVVVCDAEGIVYHDTKLETEI